MTEIHTQNDRKGKSPVEILKDSLLIIITLIFILLYAAAYTNKFDPLKDNTMLSRLEPIIFILIGYSLGQLPARKSERSLTEEIARQTQKADAAQFAKEKAQIERETLEEKIKNARMALNAIVLTETNNRPNAQIDALKTAVGILDS